MRRPLATAALLVGALAPSCCSVPVEVEAAGTAAGGARGRVVLLHGLARTSRSMERLRRALNEAGYDTCNIPYPSTDAPLEELATTHVLPLVERYAPNGETLHFVTHSLGGLIVRQLVADGALSNVGRVVMLGPPNGGSEVADAFEGDWLYRHVNGPVGAQLGTSAHSPPRLLGGAPFELGIIAGDRTVNPILSLIIPGPDDGKVSVENAKLEGMRDFRVLHTTHTFMMQSRRTIAEVLHFLEHGTFTPPPPET